MLVALTQDLPEGTNLALLQFLWMLVSGALLPQRGALFPALQARGLSAQANFHPFSTNIGVLKRKWAHLVRQI
jgi:hypothetical protein